MVTSFGKRHFPAAQDQVGPSPRLDATRVCWSETPHVRLPGETAGLGGEGGSEGKDGSWMSGACWDLSPPSAW